MSLLAVWMLGRGAVCVPQTDGQPILTHRDSHAHNISTPHINYILFNSRDKYFLGDVVTNIISLYGIYSLLVVMFHLKNLNHVWIAHNESDSNPSLVFGVWRWGSGIVIYWGQEKKWLCTSSYTKGWRSSERWKSHAMCSWKKGKFGISCWAERSVLLLDVTRKERELERPSALFVQLIPCIPTFLFQPSTFPFLRAHSHILSPT